MPHAARVAIVDESLVELRPLIIPAQEAESGEDLEPEERGGHVGVRGVSMREGIAEHEVGLENDLAADHGGGFLSRLRLRELRVESVEQVVVLAAVERHVREHDQRVHARRRGAGREHVVVAHANEWLLREGRLEKCVDTLEDAASGAAESRIVLVAGLRERGGGGFAEDLSRPCRTMASSTFPLPPSS